MITNQNDTKQARKYAPIKSSHLPILEYTKDLGPLLLGAHHTHQCKCGKTTTGTGCSYCPKCAATNTNRTEKAE